MLFLIGGFIRGNIGLIVGLVCALLVLLVMVVVVVILVRKIRTDKDKGTIC